MTKVQTPCLATVLLLLATACGPKNLRMEVSHTTGSTLFVCADGVCKPAPKDVPEQRNEGRLTFFALPKECARLHEVFVEDACGTSKIYVQCAPEENAFETVGPKSASPAPSSAPNAGGTR